MSRDFAPSEDYFRAPREAYGPSSRVLLAAGHRVVLEGLDDRLLGIVESHGISEAGEGVPAGEGAGVPAIHVRLLRAGVPAFLEMTPGEDYRLKVRTSGEDVFAWSYGFGGRVSLARQSADLCLTEQPDWMLRTSLVNFLRVLYSRIALDAGGFLFHSSGVLRDGRAWLFFGPSESGKTTVASLSHPHPVLNDDLLFLSRDGGTFTARGLPWSGQYQGVKTPANEPCTVAGLFRLVKAPEVRRQRLGLAHAVVEVLASIPFSEVRHPGESLLDRVTELVRRVPVYRLHFRKDPSFWEAVLTPPDTQEPRR